jgi:hypothetical protein
MTKDQHVNQDQESHNQTILLCNRTRVIHKAVKDHIQEESNDQRMNNHIHFKRKIGEHHFFLVLYLKKIKKKKRKEKKIWIIETNQGCPPPPPNAAEQFSPFWRNAVEKRKAPLLQKRLDVTSPYTFPQIFV